jgi:uncharacterized protein YcbK (DUF882 family)
MHMEFAAFDFHAGGRVALRDLYVWLDARDTERMWGIGLYEARGYVHFDTGRARLGRPYPWRHDDGAGRAA